MVGECLTLLRCINAFGLTRVMSEIQITKTCNEKGLGVNLGLSFISKFIDYTIALNSRNSKPASNIVTGRVISQAMSMFFTVPMRRFLMPLEATIDPATPDESTWVVLAGSPNAVVSPIVVAATKLALVPWA